MDTLSDDLLLCVFEFLSLEESVQDVSHRFRAIWNSNQIWGPHTIKLWEDEIQCILTNTSPLSLLFDGFGEHFQKDAFDNFNGVIQLVNKHQDLFSVITPWRMQYDVIHLRRADRVSWISQTDGARLLFPNDLEHVPQTTGRRFWIDLEALLAGPDFEEAKEWHQRVLRRESFCLHLEVEGKERACKRPCRYSVARISLAERDGLLHTVVKTPLFVSSENVARVLSPVFEWGRNTSNCVKKLFKRRIDSQLQPSTYVWQCGYEAFAFKTLEQWIELNQDEKKVREQMAQSQGFCGRLHGPGDETFSHLIRYACGDGNRSIESCEPCAVKWSKENGCMACPECITPLGQNEAMYERDPAGFKRRKLLRPRF